jgi:ribosomal-protein-alanine N-acetyltransferase
LWGANSVNISTILPGNIAGVVALESSLESGWPIASVRQEIDRPSGLQLVACGDGAGVVIGWCCGIWIGEEAELLRIAVAQAERIRGVASALLAQFEKECAERRVASIFLEVAGANMAARRLYEKFLYSQVGRRKKYYSQPVDDALAMKKILL